MIINPRFLRGRYLQTAVFILSVALPQLVSAQSTFSFLNAPASARAAALGGVNVSLADRDLTLVSGNPTLAGDTLTSFASVNNQFYVADVGLSALYLRPEFGKIGAVNVSIHHMNYGTIKGYDASGVETGDFTSGETAFAIGKHMESNNFRFGATLKTIFSNLAGYRASALAVDMGGLFVHPEKNATIGIAIRNLGVTLSDYSPNSSSRLPFDVQVGATIKPEHMPFRFSLTAFDLTRYQAYEADNDKLTTTDKVVRHLNVGTELLLGKNVNILAAYNFRKRQELKLQEVGGGAGFSLGLAITLKRLEFVFNRNSYGPGQAIYGVSLSANLKTMMPKREKI